MEFSLEPGAHIVEMAFVDTPVRRWATWLSLLSLLSMLLLLLKGAVQRFAREE